MTSIQLIVITIVMWGVGAILYKIANQNLHPVLICAIGTIVYMIVTPLYFVLFKVDYNWNIKGVVFAALAALLMVIGALSYDFSLQKSSVSEVTVAVSLYPALTVLLSFIFLQEQFTFRKLIGMGLAFISIYIISKG